jgi:hypothetical protein
MYAACAAHPTLPVLITLMYEEGCELLILNSGEFYGFSFSLVGSLVHMSVSLVG